MSKKIAVIVLFLALLIAPTVYWLVTGHDSVAEFDSESEKRLPTAFPSAEMLISSENDSSAFFSQIEDFFNDRLPFRNLMLKLYDDADNATSSLYSSAVESLFDALHTHRYAVSSVTATCTEDGYTEYTCLCGDTYRDGEVPASGHLYRETVTAPTCLREGCTTHTCERCGDSYTDCPTEIVSHIYESVLTEPTCDEEGYTTYTCTMCGREYRDLYTVSLGHLFGEPETVREANCETDGLIIKKCMRCLTEQVVDTPAKLGHDLTEWTVTVEATTSCEGSRRRTCNRCNYVQISPIAVLAVGHTHQYTLETVAPTCAVNGYTYYICSCGDRYDDRILVASHRYELVSSVPACESDGAETYICAVCGDTYTKTFVKQGHDFVFTETVAPTCLDNGYDLYTCARCGETRQSDIVPATNAHSWGSWKVTKKASYSTEGEQTRTCKNCTEKQTKTIDVLSIDLKTGTKTPNGFTVGQAIDSTFKRASAGIRSDGYYVTNNVNNWILFMGDGNDSCYNDLVGNGLYTLAQKKAFAEKINHLNEVCEAYGKTLVITVCPNKSNLYSEYMVGTASTVQRVDQMMKYLEQNTSATIVWSQALEEMKIYKKTYELYFRYDSHWNAAGGFVWANNILRKLGLPYTSLYDVDLTVKNRSKIPTAKKIENCLIGTTVWGIDQDGDLRCNNTGRYAVDDKDYIINYLTGVSYTIENYRNDRNNYYNNPEYTGIYATSTSTNKQSCVLLGDSFRRALNPVLVKNFSSYLSYFYTDIGATECQDAIHSADVIILECAERLFDINNFELFSSTDLIERLEYYITH